MSTVVARTVASTPDRTASQTWAKIASLLAPDGESAARAELERVAGVAAASISSEAPKDDAFVVYGGGPRVRVYCAFGDDAVTKDGVNEDELAESPTKGDWRMSMPVPPEDLDWSQKKLKGLSSRITARAIGEDVPDKDEKEGKAASASAEIDREEFFRSMSTAVSVNTYTHTVTYVTTKMLLSLKEIIRLIGLDPAKITDEWGSLETAISTWLNSKHLRQVTVEVFSKQTDKLVTRWDLDVVYGYTGDGSLWTDIDGLKYAIAKAGVAPSGCSYRFLLLTWPNGPKVPGWSSTEYRSTEGFKRYGVGATIGGNGLATETSYWRQ